ncbi:hypothetical protein CEUSTIGMA_g2664.t1 [Chlamydomonas eustigma]|uniref:Spermatogenesis-associated protein 17 n=1 Tax=Chlamydomonas eustigma TaxID=1157962 RepID=A0A250WXG4_9CHLO|nr:hypothetical protein CEUSTIGMA_g2664.t1 [Chlamydomonas eustigma]|eukprot:GAX75220.1 hypothetical protein CEUSTIGMA_g2664.t1 [Chlamydomonas eustigma]
MSTLARLKSKVPSVLEEYFKACSLAESKRSAEVRAAIVIESCARGFLTRRRLKKLTDVVVNIQRYWRGYLGRLRATLALEIKNKKLRELYFDAQASVIQRHWRGFWSRKSKFDFYARKRYLKEVHSKNAEIRKEMEAEAQRAISAQREMAEDMARRLFDSRVGQLHHLVSTAAQPGIFNSPYALATKTVPLVLGAPVEEHLKASFKSQAAQHLPPIKKLGKKATHPSNIYASEALVDGHKLPASVTLRQAVPYDKVHQADLLEEKVHRSEMLKLHPTPFAGSMRPPFYPTIDPQSIRNVEKYKDPHDPTVGTRNETFSAAMQAMSDKPFLKYQHKQAYFNPVMNKESY